MKVCTKCEEEKSSSEFYKNSWGKGGLRSVCKECDKKRLLEYRRNSERYQQWAREYQRERYRNENFFVILEHPWPEFINKRMPRGEFAKKNIHQWIWVDARVVVEDPRDNERYEATHEGLKKVEQFG